MSLGKCTWIIKTKEHWKPDLFCWARIYRVRTLCFPQWRQWGRHTYSLLWGWYRRYWSDTRLESEIVLLYKEVYIIGNLKNQRFSKLSFWECKHTAGPRLHAPWFYADPIIHSFSCTFVYAKVYFLRHFVLSDSRFYEYFGTFNIFFQSFNKTVTYPLQWNLRIVNL